MIEFTKHTLDNGLTILIHSDLSTPLIAMDLGYYEWFGQPGLINSEPERYGAVTPSSIRETARSLFNTQNCSCLVYIPTQTK